MSWWETDGPYPDTDFREWEPDPLSGGRGVVFGVLLGLTIFVVAALIVKAAL